MINREMAYILTQEIVEDYNKSFYNLGVYKNLDSANKRMDKEIEYDIEFNNLELNNRDGLSAELNSDWTSVVYKIDVQFLE